MAQDEWHQPIRKRIHALQRSGVFNTHQRRHLGRRPVGIETAPASKSRGLGGHAVLDPPGGEENDLWKLAHDPQVRLKPAIGVQVVVQVAEAKVAGNPGAVHDHGDGRARTRAEFGGSLKDFPLFRSHEICSSTAGRPLLHPQRHPRGLLLGRIRLAHQNRLVHPLGSLLVAAGA